MRLLGRTGLSVSALSLGAMAAAEISQPEADRLFNQAIDAGINLIDTAPEYGRSEERIGRAISHRRGEVILATKCGDYLPGDGPNPISPGILYTRDVFRSNIERSLTLLRTDAIDLMQMHGLMPQYLPSGEHDELVELLRLLKQEGKIRHIGCTFRSGRPGDPLYPTGYGYRCLQAFMDWRTLETIQVAYGALARECEEAISEASAHGFGIIVRGAIRSYHSASDRLFDAANLQELFRPDESRAQFLLRFALSQAGVSTVLVGTGTGEHLMTNVLAAERGALAQDLLGEAMRRLDAVDVHSRSLRGGR